MLANVNCPPGSYWCAAAVSTWGKEALGQRWPLPMTADCDVLLAKGRKLGKSSTPNPRSGDIFLLVYASDPNDAHHTGVVTSVGSDGTFGTIEGNTNTGGSSNGIGVFARTRVLSPLYRFVRWADAFTDATIVPTFTPEQWACLVGADRIPMSVDGGVGWVPVREVMKALYGPTADRRLAWGADTPGLTWDEKPVPFAVRLQGGVSLAKARDIALWQGCDIAASSATKEAKFVRKAVTP
jgi:hypothetical protein